SAIAMLRQQSHSFLFANRPENVGSAATRSAGTISRTHSPYLWHKDSVLMKFQTSFGACGSAGSSRCALASIQPGLRGFDQVRPGLGRVVNARSFGKPAVVIHYDAACATSSGQRSAAGIDGRKATGDV